MAQVRERLGQPNLLVVTNVAHIDGGFAEWVKQDAPVKTCEAHCARRNPK